MMIEMSSAEIDQVFGGGPLGVSGETWGCAIGGAVAGAASGGNPWAGAAGCIAGAAIANSPSGVGSIGGISGPAGIWGLIHRLRMN